MDELVDSYLDGKLDSFEVEAFEHRLQDDPELADALLQGLTLRAMFQIAFEPASGAEAATPDPGVCHQVRLLGAAYRDGTLEPEAKGVFCEHLETCAACESHYRAHAATARAPRRRSRRLLTGLLALVAAGGGLGIWGLANFGDSAASPVEASSSEPSSLADQERVALTLTELAQQQIGPDQSALAAARELWRNHEGELFRHLETAPSARDLVRETGILTGSLSTERAMLLVCASDERQPASERVSAFQALAKEFADRAHRVLRYFLFTSPEAEVFSRAALHLKDLSWQGLEDVDIRDLFERARSLRALDGADILLDEIEKRTDKGDFFELLCSLIGDEAPAARTSTVLGLLMASDPVRARPVLEKATVGTHPLFRIEAADRLWRKTQDRRWHEAVGATVDAAIAARDETVIKAALKHYRRHLTDGDRDRLDRITRAFPNLAGRVRKLLQKLDSQRTSHGDSPGEGRSPERAF